MRKENCLICGDKIQVDDEPMEYDGYICKKCVNDKNDKNNKTK